MQLPFTCGRGWIIWPTLTWCQILKKKSNSCASLTDYTYKAWLVEHCTDFWSSHSEEVPKEKNSDLWEHLWTIKIELAERKSRQLWQGTNKSLTMTRYYTFFQLTCCHIKLHLFSIIIHKSFVQNLLLIYYNQGYLHRGINQASLVSLQIISILRLCSWLWVSFHVLFAITSNLINKTIFSRRTIMI